MYAKASYGETVDVQIEARDVHFHATLTIHSVRKPHGQALRGSEAVKSLAPAKQGIWSRGKRLSHHRPSSPSGTRLSLSPASAR